MNVTLAGLKDELSRVSQQLVTQSDRLCCGEETWWDAGSKPLQRMKVSLPGVSESGLEITWVKKELDAGDQCFYIGPSLASNSVVERGDACQIAAAGGCGHLKYRSVFFPRANITLMVHEQHLSRSPPGFKVTSFRVPGRGHFLLHRPSSEGLQWYHVAAWNAWRDSGSGSY